MMAGGGIGGGESNSRPMSEINTTPLVDVMLVLLVIFIITAPLLTHAVKIDLPQATSQPSPEKPDIVDVAIDSAGVMYWNDQVVTLEEMGVKLNEVASKEPQPELHIRADKDTRYQILADVMAHAQNAGVQKLGFVSDPSPK